MEAQNNQPIKPVAKKSGIFTKISTIEEAEKPIRSIWKWFSVIAVLCIIGGVVFIVAPIMLKNLKPTAAMIVGVINIVYGIVTFYYARQFKKNRTLQSANVLLFCSSAGLISAVISLNPFAIIIYLVVFFSGIDARGLIKQLDKLKSEENKKELSTS